MLSLENKEKLCSILNVNMYGLSNIIRNLSKKLNKNFNDVDMNDLYIYINSQDEKVFWDEIFKICEENNYKGNPKFILNTVACMKDERCHTNDKIQNVKNYFEIMNYNNYLKENHLSELTCQCCGKKFLDKPNTKYCQDCWIEVTCCTCGKKLNRLRLKNDEENYYCNECKGKLSVE